MITDINSEDRLVQRTFAQHLEKALGWESVYAYNSETFGPNGTLGRASEREVVLVRDLRAALARLNPDLPGSAREQAVEKLTRVDFARSLVQHNREFYGFIRGGVPVEWRDSKGATRHALARIIDFRAPDNNRFLAVRELKVQGVRVPHYNRRADLVCFVNGLPLVFIELKAVYKNIRAGFDENLTDYLHEHSIAHAFHHNAFLVVSNGDHARYGSITSKWEHFVAWKRNDEKAKGRVDAEACLDGMMEKERLLDLVENFILFDDSRSGGTRKIVARNHQVLGVNNAVASVQRQEALKRQFPPERRLIAYTLPEAELLKVAEPPPRHATFGEPAGPGAAGEDDVPLLKRAHPDLGRLGVFWHTQGSGKSYSMAFFAEKVRRVVPGNFTFVVMTDREDLDDQIWRTFTGCSVADETMPRAGSGRELKDILRENHRFVFSLIHKFNQPVTESYSERDDIIVISDEAHRTQAGRFARNMRRALPNAAFIGFTGPPLFKHEHLTRRIFGGYVSRYDFKRSEEDQSTVKLVYENRGEKLGIARLDLRHAPGIVHLTSCSRPRGVRPAPGHALGMSMLSDGRCCSGLGSVQPLAHLVANTRLEAPLVPRAADGDTELSGDLFAGEHAGSDQSLLETREARRGSNPLHAHRIEGLPSAVLHPRWRHARKKPSSLCQVAPQPPAPPRPRPRRTPFVPATLRIRYSARRKFCPASRSSWSPQRRVMILARAWSWSGLRAA